jgi:hypothetical protein
MDRREGNGQGLTLSPLTNFVPFVYYRLLIATGTGTALGITAYA